MSAAPAVRRTVSRRGGRRRSSRHGADEALGDRLIMASAGLVSAVAGALIAAYGRGTPAAVFAGLVTLCVTPGMGLACWLTTKDRWTRAMVVLAASLTWSILVTAVLAWLQVTSLGALITATAGAGGMGSAGFLIAQRNRIRHRVPVRDPVDERHPSPRRDEHRPGPRPSPADAEPSPASRVALVGGMIALVAAAGLLADAMIRARGHHVGSYGLLPKLGVPFLAAIVLTVGALPLALRSIRTAWPVAAAALGLLLVELDGTPVFLSATPLSSWTYKHFGVVDYVVHGGALRDPLDIYQQWPGFFAVAAGLVRLSGRSPLAYANWSQLFFAALNAIALFAIARRLSAQHQVVPYIAVLLLMTADWEGQIYFSPQTLAFLLALLFQFFLVPFLEPERLRRLFRNRRWLTISPLAIPDAGRVTGREKALREIGIVALFGAIVVTHQLSPYLVFAGVACLWVLGVMREPWPLLACAAMLVAYPLLHVAAVEHNSVLTGFSFSNAAGSQGGSQSTSPQQRLASALARPIALGLWGATAICVLSYRRRLGVVAVPAILALVPFTFALVSSYDGEAIYRVFLFSSPWCALIIARGLADLRRLPTLRWTAVACWAIFAALGSAQAQDFGLYRVVQVPRSEISADAYFLKHAPKNSLLMLVSANFPSHVNWRYVLHDAGEAQNDLSLDEIPRLHGNGLKGTSAKDLAILVTRLDAGAGYLAFGPSMVAYNNYYRLFSPGTLSSLVPRLEGSRYWKVWYENDGTFIFRALPPGNSGGR